MTNKKTEIALMCSYPDYVKLVKNLGDPLVFVHDDQLGAGIQLLVLDKVILFVFPDKSSSSLLEQKKSVAELLELLKKDN